MLKMMSFCSLLIYPLGIFCLTLENAKQKQMAEDVNILTYYIERGYAPLEWKQEHLNYNLQQAQHVALEKIWQTPVLSMKEFHQVVKKYINSLQDYHAEVRFTSTESASLPFQIKGADNRYFISWIDRKKLSKSAYHFDVNDELISFDERPIKHVMEELYQRNKKAKESTDRSLAEMKLTFRSGAEADFVPSGPVFIQTRSAKTGQVYKWQLIWNYQPEQIHYVNFNDSQKEVKALALTSFSFKELFQVQPNKNKNKKEKELGAQMINPSHLAQINSAKEDERGLGTYKSFLPNLGAILWEPLSNLSNSCISENEQIEDNGEGSKAKEYENEDLCFYASSMFNTYIYQHPEGYAIGYIRIPHYVGFDDDVLVFADLIKFMQKYTDALVIDQLNNPGGYVSFVYNLAAFFTAEALPTPSHRMKITTDTVLSAHHKLQNIQKLDWLLEEVDVCPANYQQILFAKQYCEHLINDWNLGLTLSRPVAIEGVDWINPSPHGHYTKPVVMLINELNFSGGDFMPAIGKEKKKFVLFGAQTAGAGGCVSSIEFPNQNGIAAFSYTISLAERPSSKKIENLGVSPDVKYELTAEDVSNGYKGYIKALNKTLTKILKTNDRI